MKSIRIGLLGCGTVGTGVVRLLTENRDLIQSRVGAALDLKYVADIDTTKDRAVRFEPGVLIGDGFRVVNDPDIDIVIELIGGLGIAKDLLLQALKNGKHVVTANKALLANQGRELFRTAGEHHVDIGFEASVGGCMPIIKTIRESLVVNRIHSLCGILNGTCNFILSNITDKGIGFDEALKEAQAGGFAEADPTLDIEGFDTAHKLAILCALAFGMEIRLEDIYIEGITRITPMDIAFAREFGYTIKLLAIGKQRDGAIEARIHPTMIPETNLLAKVSGSLNAITVGGDAVGDILIHGRGAGMMPTASAVLGDVVDIARDMMHGVRSGRIPGLSWQPEHIRPIPVMPIGDIETHYYIRFSAEDRPSVLSRISGILGSRNISIQSVHQKGRKSKGAVPIVMLIHKALEANVRSALADIEQLDVMIDKPMLIRIEDEEGFEQ